MHTPFLADDSCYRTSGYFVVPTIATPEKTIRSKPGAADSGFTSPLSGLSKKHKIFSKTGKIV